MTPPAAIRPIVDKLLRRKLWKMRSVQDFLDLEYEQVLAMIQNGELCWAFDIGSGGARGEPHVLAHCAVEKKYGMIKEIGRLTRKLTFYQVVQLILPRRHVRSTELKRIFSCGSDHIHKLAKDNFTVAREPKAADGPNSFTVFNRASIAKFLSERRMI
jgi:hypothetical protein